VLRPPGPATAATTAHPPGTKRSSRNDRPIGENRPATASGNRITLAVLEMHTAERARGYDPYNASPSHVDIQAWKRRQKPG
jgi:hypothetical protein